MYELDKRKKSKLCKELDLISKKNKGVISKPIIVEEAQIKGSYLNNLFKDKGLFDAKKTMEYAQMTFAGMILRSYQVWVTVEDGEPIKTRGFVSLSTDRKKGTGIYRPIVNIMKNDKHREIMLNDAIKELNAFKHKYATLTELAPIFEAIDSIK